MPYKAHTWKILILGQGYEMFGTAGNSFLTGFLLLNWRDDKNAIIFISVDICLYTHHYD